jgi:uncharacterized protein YdeI (YjbR/CyaY-like superfamily)
MATNGTTRRTTRKRIPMPAFVRRALGNEAVMEAYRQRPPFQRNDYLLWIAGAKTEPTRQKRLAQMVRELRSGDRYMNMAWRPRAPLR